MRFIALNFCSFYGLEVSTFPWMAKVLDLSLGRICVVILNLCGFKKNQPAYRLSDCFVFGLRKQKDNKKTF